MTKAAVRDYFSLDAESYRHAYEEDSSRGVIFRERQHIVLNILRDPIGRVLDVGAGPGVFTEPMVRRNAVCWTVDLSLEMLSIARRVLPLEIGDRNHLIGGDAMALPFANGSFDSIVCSGVLQYADDVDGAIRELGRCLRPGGQLVLTFPNRDSPLNRLHAGAVRAARAAQAVGRWLGAKGVSPVRLTFRRDIPNRSFVCRKVVATAARERLIWDSTVYHCVTFPFTLPGLGPLIRAWNRRALSGTLAGDRQRWGREAIVRFVRS